VGEVIEFADIVRMRRRRSARQLHVSCLAVLQASVVVASAELALAPPRERAVRIARLHKLEELHEYACAFAG
jgi:hypothetical protein